MKWFNLITMIKLILTALDTLVQITGPVYLYWKVQMIFYLSGGWTVGRSYKYPPKEGNMMSDFCPPLKPEQTSTAEREPASGEEGGGEACARGGVVGAGLNV